jgi:hypothetical protein
MTDERITLAVGETRRVSLPSRGSAGFSWDLRVTGESVSIARTSGPPPPLPPPGGLPPSSYSLDEVLILTGTHPGETVIEGALRRPGGRVIEQRTLRVRVVASSGRLSADHRSSQTAGPMTGPSCQPPPSRQ